MNHERNIFLLNTENLRTPAEGAITDLTVWGRELSEEEMVDAIIAAHEAIKPIIKLQEKMVAKVGKEKLVATEKQIDNALYGQILEWARREGIYRPGPERRAAGPERQPPPREPRGTGPVQLDVFAVRVRSPARSKRPAPRRGKNGSA